jgi:hypothetical protein
VTLKKPVLSCLPISSETVHKPKDLLSVLCVVICLSTLEVRGGLAIGWFAVCLQENVQEKQKMSRDVLVPMVKPIAA